MCTEGTRFCREGEWSRCEDPHSYVVTPDPSLAALVNPDASPVTCSICDVTCFKVTDPLTLTDGSAPGNNVSYGPGGGLTLAPADAGMGMMDSGADGGSAVTGCPGLQLCCDSLAGEPVTRGNCETIVGANNNAACDAAIQTYCPRTITGPIDGCTIGSGSIDVDCDGIPDAVDECTPSTVASNPECQGNVLPLAGTNNQTIFHVLDEGESGSNSIEIGFQVRNADVYFMFDMSYTMGEARNNLVSSMQTGNFVECALLRNCCETLTGTARTSCLNVAGAATQNQNNCRNSQATYCAVSPQLTDCPDLNFDGLPDNDNKTKGVVGAVRCLVGSSWFGAGMTNDLPVGSHGDKDEWAFKNYVDMTPDVDKVRNQLARMLTNKNNDYPEGQMAGLYSVLTGKGHYFGNESVSVPERVGAGCPSEAWGYPCFRKDTVPIIVFFTDARMYNGPPQNSNPLYAANYARNGRTTTSGVAAFTPEQSEAFSTAMNLGSVNNQFKVISGNLQFMQGDLPGSITGCSAESGAPDALYRFTVDPLLSPLGIPLGTPVSVKFEMNRRQFGSSSGGDIPAPATQTPVVMSLYNGVPSAIQSPQNIGSATVYSIPSGPDLTYLTYLGVTSSTNSTTGFLGGISGCGADGQTNQVAFTFRPVVDAHVVIDASESEFGTAISLHEGLPSALPANPTGVRRVVLVGPAGNTNDTFATARSIPPDGDIDNDYVTYIGDTLALQNAGTGSAYNSPTGKTGRDDYDDSVVACGVNPIGADAVFRFDVDSPRRVRIDTEGSAFNTVISLHDGPPPQAYAVTSPGGNGSSGTAYRIGQSSADSVSDTSYEVFSAAGGTTPLGSTVDPVCGGDATLGANDAFYSFRLTSPTHLNVRAEGRSGTAMAGEAFNTPGSANAAAISNPPPAASGTLPVINELVVDHTGSDTREYVEILGQPETSYANYRIVQLESDNSGSMGEITALIVPGTTNGAGYWVSAFLNSQLDNGSSSFLLVECPFGGCVGLTLGTDLDADDDGSIDFDPLPWARVADDVAILDGGSGDQAYASAILPNSLAGGSGAVGGASRIPSGRDTDGTADWMRNDADGDGLPGFGFDPYVFLYTSPPGAATHVDVAANNHNNQMSARDLGDVFGQVTTYVDNANLANAATTNDYPEGVVSCAARTGCFLPGVTCASTAQCCAGLTCTGTKCVETAALGRDDHVYKFTPSSDGTVRLSLDSTGAGYASMAIYDDVPPNSGAVPVTQLFDASLLASPPGPSCTAYSRNGHIYWFCAQGLSWDAARTNCLAAGGHLARVDNASEDGFLSATRTSTQTWIGGRDTSTTGTRNWVWSDTSAPNVFWTGTQTGSAPPPFYASWQSNEPGSTSEDCAAYYTSGTSRWSDRTCTTAYHYICEISTPAVTPPENAATAYNVGSIAGAIRAYAGATRRMNNDYAIAGPSQCGAALTAPDAVFRLTPTTGVVNATFDTSGSDFHAIVSVYQGSISAGTYLGCDAPGVQPGTDVTAGVPVTGTDPLELDLVAGQTYFVVITGSSVQREGSYKLKISDPAAGGDGVQLACGVETSAPIAIEADFDANKTYYVIVEATSPASGAYALTAHSVYRNRYSVENPLSLNEHGNSAFELADPYRSKIQVKNTSTAGMAANYTAAELTCGSADASPDAVYTFTPSINTNVRIAAAMPGPPSKQPVVALFRGQPSSTATITNVDNSNEAGDSAFIVGLNGPAQTLVGNTSMMVSNIDGSLMQCGAALEGRDAVFRFTLPEATTVEIDASASAAMGMIGDPVIALFRDFSLERPAPYLLENDSYTDANVYPTPTPVATGDWLVYEADMVNLTPATQTSVAISATNMNDVVNPTTLTGAQDLGDVWNTRVAVGGGRTTSLRPDYDVTGWVSGHPMSPDAVYEFHSGVDTQVRIKATPSSWDTVIALYDGTNGAPLRAVDNQTVTTTLSAIGCGNGLVDFNEECDDANATVGDGCDNCSLEHLGRWRCDPLYYDQPSPFDECDCGCGVVDPDCADATAASCEYLWFPPGKGCVYYKPGDPTDNNLDPTNNAECLPPMCNNKIVELGEQCDDGDGTSGDGCSATCLKELSGVWTCPPSWQNDTFCDCGCGVHDDIGCGVGNNSVGVCQYCNGPGACSLSPCPGTIDPVNNTQCVTTPNPNNAIEEAIDVQLGGGGTRRFVGTLVAMPHDVDVDLMCGAHPASRDAIYEFTLRRSTRVRIDASASAVDPAVSLYNSAALGESPSPIVLENDEAADADMNPAPTPEIGGAAFRYIGDIANLSISTQPQVTIDNRENVNETQPTDLTNPMNKRVTVVGASTSGMAATHPAPQCGGVDNAADALYRFVPSETGEIRLSTNYPQTTFDTVIALYDGENGPPATLAELNYQNVSQSPTNENELSSRNVDIESGAYRFTGSTSTMVNDVDASLFVNEMGAACGAVPGSPDAVWSFSLSEPTSIDIDPTGTGFSGVIGIFDGPMTRPSTTTLSSNPASLTQLYDTSALPGQPDTQCTPFDYGLHRYWVCSNPRTWDTARAACADAGHDLVSIESTAENTEVFAHVGPTGLAHSIGLRQVVPFSGWGAAPNGIWASGVPPTLTTNALWYSNEPNQVENVGARMRSQDGRWIDTATSWGLAPFICEDDSASIAALPAPPTSSNPQVVDLFGHARHFVGSTTGVTSSVGNTMGCMTAASAPDAVFRMDIAYTTAVRINVTGFSGGVMGLYRGGIGPVNYTDAGSVCTSINPAGVIDRNGASSLTAGVWYVVLSSTVASGANSSGNYDILFTASTTDPAAFRLEPDTLFQAAASTLGPIEDKWVVKTADMANLTTDLITTRVVDMGAGTDTNSSHVSPFTVRNLGSTDGQQVSTERSSTTGLTSDYPAPMCGNSADSLDAIYSFSVSNAATVRASIQAQSGQDMVVALFDGGTSGRFPLLKSQVPPSAAAVANNDLPTQPTTPPQSGTSAYQVPTFLAANTFSGNIAMPMNLPNKDRLFSQAPNYGSQICDASPNGYDAWFTFTLTNPMTVQIDAGGTGFDHTVALFDSSPIMTPAAITAAYDTQLAATVAELPVTDRWHVMQGSTAGLLPGNVTRVTAVAGTDFLNDDDVNNDGTRTNTEMIQDLGVLAANTQIVTSGATTAAADVYADYPVSVLQCGTADGADDQIFQFQSTYTGPARITIDRPSAAFPAAMAVFDGAMGPPQTQGDIDPVATAVTGNHSRALAAPVWSVAMPAPLEAYSGNTATLASDTQAANLYNEARVHTEAPGYVPGVCSADPTGKDAFYRFTLAAPTNVRVAVQGDATAYPHTLALYNSATLSMPAAVARQNDTRANAASTGVAIDQSWVHYVTDMSPAAPFGTGNMTITGLSHETLLAGTDFQNANGVQDLFTSGGSLSVAQMRTDGADSTNAGATYGAPICGGTPYGDANANDMLFRVRSTTNTTVRVGVDNPAPGFNPVLAVYNGIPLTAAESTTSAVDLNATGNTNENITNARQVLTGARTTLTGNVAAMMSNYDGSQFEDGSSVCTPDQVGRDAFVEVEVVTLPKTVRDDLELWVDAADDDNLVLSGSAVSTARDKSGLSNNPTQGTVARQPARQLRANGYALELNPAGDLSSTNNGTEDNLVRDPYTGDSPVSVFAVWRLLNTSFLADARLLSTNIQGGAAGFTFGMSAAGVGAQLQYRDSANNAVAMTGALNGATTPMISAVTHSATGGITTFLNGTQHATGTGRVAGTLFQRLRIGSNDDTTQGLPMDLHELLVVRRAISASERQQIEGYLAHKWGLASSLPAGHPYLASPPTRTVEVSSQGTAFAHTLSFFDAEPMTRPAATGATSQRTSAAALAAPLGPINGAWMVRSATNTRR